jgi:hypothetical protein
MLQAAQPFPGDSRSPDDDECFGEERFYLYSVSDTEYCIMNQESEDSLTIEKELLNNPDFMPALWYAQMRMHALGLDPEEALNEERYLNEIGDVPSGAVELMLRQHPWDESSDAVPLDRFEIQMKGEDLVISDRVMASVFMLPGHLLLDPSFDLINWYTLSIREFESEERECHSPHLSGFESDLISSESDLEFSSEDPDVYLSDGPPSLQTVSNSEAEHSSDRDSVPDLQSVSDSSDEDNLSDDGVPDLMSVSDSSDEETESDDGSDSGPPSLRSITNSSDSGSDNSEATHLIFPGEDGEVFEDRMRFWAEAMKRVCSEINNEGPPPRSRRLGDVLGSTTAALLEFFQPYPGDERVPWADEHWDSVRFRVLRPSLETYVIEDSYFDEVTVLPLEYLRVPAFHLCEWYARQHSSALGIEYAQASPIHQFPIEEILADAVQQYVRDVSRHSPEFSGVEISRILREPDELEGPDTFTVSIPLGAEEIFQYIFEEDLLNPRLDFVGWIVQRLRKYILHQNDMRHSFANAHRVRYFGSMFDEPEEEAEGESLLFCGGAQIPPNT